MNCCCCGGLIWPAWAICCLFCSSICVAVAMTLRVSSDITCCCVPRARRTLSSPWSFPDRGLFIGRKASTAITGYCNDKHYVMRMIRMTRLLCYNIYSDLRLWTSPCLMWVTQVVWLWQSHKIKTRKMCNFIVLSVCNITSSNEIPRSYLRFHEHLCNPGIFIWHVETVQW